MDLELEISKLSPQPGDLLVFTTEKVLSRDTVEHIVDTVRPMMPEGVQFVITDNGARIESFNDISLARLGLRRIEA